MLPLADWRQRGAMLDLLGHRLFVVDDRASTQAAVLMIHGFPTASWDWAPVWDDIARVARPVTMDMLGFGFSDKPARHEYTIMEQADLFEALLAKLGIDACHVLAHDYGDSVAQELLARHNRGLSRCRLLSVCLLNGGLFPETHRARFVQKLLLSPAGPLVGRCIGRAAFGRSIRAVFGPHSQPSTAEIDAFWALATANGGRRIFHRLIRYMPERRRHRERWLDALCNTDVPIGLVNGLADPVSGVHMLRRFEELVGRNHFVCRLEAIGHYPQLEAPADVVSAWRTFVSRAPD